jgi:SSS family solute:Na+ symporter
MPKGLVGILVAAMFSALMSSLASVFNSCSTIFTIDFYKHIRPQASETELVMSGRLATIVTVILGLLWIPMLPYFSDQLWLYLQSVQV